LLRWAHPGANYEIGFTEIVHLLALHIATVQRPAYRFRMAAIHQVGEPRSMLVCSAADGFTQVVSGINAWRQGAGKLFCHS
jgi:hypothetical protein